MPGLICHFEAVPDDVALTTPRGVICLVCLAGPVRPSRVHREAEVTALAAASQA